MALARAHRVGKTLTASSAERAPTPALPRGHGAAILLGDVSYYARFGFSALKTAELSLPGPFERGRLLGLERCQGALDDAWGMIAPGGAAAQQRKPRPSGKARKSASHAA
jgi:predicted N-acetyltransferase YhbS